MCLLVLSSGSWVAFAPVSVRCVVFCCLSLGASGVFFSSCRPRPEDWLYFPRYALGYILQLARRFLRCFGTLDLSIRSIASVGHMVMCVVKVQMVGARRSPGATMLGSRSCTSSANHHSPVPPTGPVLSDASWWTMYEMAGCLHPDGFLFLGFFWDFGSLYWRRRGVISYALSRQPYFPSLSLRGLRLRVAHKPAERHVAMFLHPDVEASRVTSCRDRRVSFCRPHFLSLLERLLRKHCWFLPSRNSLSRWHYHLCVAVATSTRFP